LGFAPATLSCTQSQHPRDGLAASKARERASIPRAQSGDRGDRQRRPRDLRSDVSDSEVEVCWRAFLRSQNAWARVRLVISDQHACLVVVLVRVFQGLVTRLCRAISGPLGTAKPVACGIQRAGYAVGRRAWTHRDRDLPSCHASSILVTRSTAEERQVTVAHGCRPGDPLSVCRGGGAAIDHCG
jgi:hypothetical protein